MRLILAGVFILALVLSLAGCARYPSTSVTNITPAQTIFSEVTVAGNINPAYYYFFAIDTSGNSSEGPVPVTLGTGFGNGWGTLSNVSASANPQQPPFFVEVHNGTAEQFRVDPTTGIANSLGAPYRWQVLAADNTQALAGPNLTVEVDASLLMPTGKTLPSFVNVNWITVQQIAQQPQNISAQTVYDGFTGTSSNSGNGFFQVPLGASNVWISGVNSVPPQQVNSPASSLPDINLVNWRIEDRLNQ